MEDLKVEKLVKQHRFVSIEGFHRRFLEEVTMLRWHFTFESLGPDWRVGWNRMLVSPTFETSILAKIPTSNVFGHRSSVFVSRCY
ncbi:hypothetical protein C943_02910 [Mariniradius saccharolyticus AK6]|uniref:Uncharacterized protein n=1 Tax=Mariniradius saccharolyticus AK6 TaxID=1239962 RepID=M7XKH1_9BACT|nr:hypothetical protein C943_02910 [Mariniradius saccharolyticus AK6]